MSIINDYHSDTSRISATMLKVFSQSPERYYRQFVTKELNVEQTEAMRLGSMLHCYVLEGEQFHQRYAVMPDFSQDARNVTAKGQRSTSKATKFYEESVAAWRAENCDTITITSDELALADTISKAILSHDQAGALVLAAGDVETPIFWHDVLPKRCRPDKIIRDFGVIVDLKTCEDASPQGFARAAAKYRYDIQAAHYREGALHQYGEPFRFIFLAVGKHPPHEVALYELTDDDLEAAERKCDELITEIARRQAEDDWKAYWQRGIVSLSLPKWTNSNFYEVNE